MVLVGSLQLSYHLGPWKNHLLEENLKFTSHSNNIRLLNVASPSSLLFQQKNTWSSHLFSLKYPPSYVVPSRYNAFRCHSSLMTNQPLDPPGMKAAIVALTRFCNVLGGCPPPVVKMVPAVSIMIFSVWGIGPFLRYTRSLLHSDSNWKKSQTYKVMTLYLQPLLLWTGATLICRALDPVVLPTESSQVVKQRVLNFVRSLSTVLAFAYCLSSMIQQAQKFFSETSESSDARNMGFQFAWKAVYSAVWVAALSLFMELLGFSTQKWLTAGGLGTVLLTLAGREIFTNFLSSVMIHATRPFVVNEWIQTRIEGYEVSGTVEHVGWWSPTIIRGEDREAVHIPNHKFTMNVVRNLSQKTHWRIKTHLAISHLDVSKINNIVADMRKVLAKNPQVEQQRLHRRVFLENVNPENQALLILISCFVKTSHFEEYLCVKEAIFLDLLRVIRHHRARLATPIRTVQKMHSDSDLESIPFSDSIFGHGGATLNRRMLMIEPPYKIYGDDRKQSHGRTSRTTTGEQNSKPIARSSGDNKASKETTPSERKTEVKTGEGRDSDTKIHSKVPMSTSEDKPSSESKHKSSSRSVSSTNGIADMPSSDAKTTTSDTDNSMQDSGSSKKSKNSSGSNNKQNYKPIHSSVSFQEDVKKPEGTTSSASQPRIEGDQTTNPSTTKPGVEENIILGVALDGSKRTLPIDDDTPSSPQTTLGAKDLAAASLNGNGATGATTPDKETKRQSPPTTSSIE
ncbi:mechanosensitive ion channel protein 2, chloroplastic-like isoform X1 [Cucurbita pepo subsp. pepo]|uniref:mechanosensitive ion channel protein 2, chloroplastic-like isoform X1 n=3 Tax=Cucurbita pepo subsp. pepo TaxID=3664 RepID=UPI000C9D8120|nr:mechanosensitive ion channel protein 2, chloroplastic-like isoform X1 [Cucurbita pepo subsp. pepo]XP_023552796.1 mechanosensitive ion channel protein 2, chloroplastic-like isoform X1 [Cucurbita pepo subsp. pepo]XP_023552797.1 mechanosensitive ion channel protein 2, chloroplastic-like isoform X1 [Cucurbita pepo subsp. pepo]XP_023552798.1 mechanosensitive ion channel protein 2, chloroplastic-like isoform X1 [Cucurbita pepo subsp. pepo]XP_023552799.1 mechanosensitive ion channel protein 2, chlo